MRSKNINRLALVPALAAGGLVHAAKLVHATPAKAIQPSSHGAALRPVTTASPAVDSQVAGWNYQLADDPLEASWSWTSRLSATGPFETRVAFHYKDARNYLLLRVIGDGDHATMRFWKVEDGQLEKLGEPEAAIGSPNGQLTLQRSSWRVRALWNSRVVVSAYSGDSGKQFGMATHGKAAVSVDRMQPTEKVFFQDDFMRAQAADAQEDSGGWHRVAGVWKTSGILNPRANADLNPNPFVYRAELAPGAPATTAMATLGNTESGQNKWFWSDYSVQVSVRPTLLDADSPLTAGVAAYYQSDGSAVIGSIDFKTGRATLSVGDHVLATSAPFAVSPNQWHRLFLDPGPGTLRLMVDGTERVRADHVISNGPDALAQGEAALQTKIGGGNYVDFDDVRVASSDSMRDDFSAPAVGRWDDAAGLWKTRVDTVHDRLKLSSGPALTLTGDPHREEGSVEADFHQLSKTAQPIGVAFAARDAANYDLARVRTVSGEARLELVEYTDGAGKILTGVKLASAVSPSISVEWRDGLITAHNGATSATVSVAEVAPGRVGAWADGDAGAVALTAFRALGAPPHFGEAKLPERIAKDRLMQNWADNAHAWKLGDDKVWWHTGDFYSDATLTVPLPPLNPGTSIALLLGTDPAVADSGGTLEITHGATGYAFKLSEGGHEVKTFTVADPAGTKPAAKASVITTTFATGATAAATTVVADTTAPATDAATAGPELRFLRQPLDSGHVLLRAALAGHVIFSETVVDAATTHGTKIGVRLDRADAPDWENVSADTSHVLDYTFTNSPVDWEAASGRWEMRERWTCTPTWGFFCGTDSVDPTLWSRFAVQGDYTLEAYIADPMDMTRGERDPMDLNITVDGDGHDLASGYSFLFAAKARTENQILRGDTIAWNKPFEQPALTGSTHQDWFYIRIERRTTPQGLNYRYSVNGKELENYTDTKPLAHDAGRIAFWTYNGGLSIARIRLWYTGVQLSLIHI